MSIKIGVMDSGAGGLTILQSIHAALPQADLLYFADQAFAPYGARDNDCIAQRLITIADYFVRQGCQLMVVACNTATVAGIAKLRAATSMPVVGVEPAVKPACSSSLCKRVTVLATLGTSKSRRLNDLIDTWRLDTQVSIVASPSLASLIDAMPQSLLAVRAEVQRIAELVQQNQSDTLVLACTHYPLIKEMFDEVLPDVVIIEPSKGVTAQVLRLLQDGHHESGEGRLSLLTNVDGEPRHALQYWATPALGDVLCIEL
ncbi:Glutamate racemase 2 [Marinomonas aquimarina]|uniref:Glutamate racemase n=1 Tax=Marinomonas aquimarina TaxID=295068 RepID=A0A1A8TFI6_9GAMM|nr:glutamate racemase [Marinomonas aquimarina]SBS31813.1 Glutamate racemase 2 [Marinomonas aquimarina]